MEPFEIVFEDDYLVVLNKKRRLLVQPGKRGEYTLTDALNKYLALKGEEGLPCHRLDRDTFGLIIYAKEKEVQRKIMEEFSKRKVVKKYIAFVKGKVKRNNWVLRGEILDWEGKKFGEKPKKAETYCKVLCSFDNFSVVELTPTTGRTHQLRIQLAEAGHPILGENRYAFRRDFKIKFRRIALHAFYLSFIHPKSGERIVVEIGLPTDMRKFLESHLKDIELEKVRTRRWRR